MSLPNIVPPIDSIESVAEESSSLEAVEVVPYGCDPESQDPHLLAKDLLDEGWDRETLGDHAWVDSSIPRNAEATIGAGAKDKVWDQP